MQSFAGNFSYVSVYDSSFFQFGDLLAITLKDSEGESEYILRLQHSSIYEDGKVFAKKQNLICETTVLGEREIGEVANGIEPKTHLQFDGTIAVIASSGAENYYHWVYQILPRIKILQESKLTFNKLYFYNLSKSYQHEMLNMLNISYDDVLVGKPGEMIMAEQILVPSIPVWPIKGKMLSSWVVDFLHDSFINQNNESEFPSKIFISRKFAKLRHIINEDKVTELLQLYGYTIVFLEKLSVSDQITMFSKANVVMGVHGSGLTNFVFCKPGTHVIEFDPYDGHRGPFQGIARSMNLEYRSIETKKGAMTQEELNRDSIFVDIEDLESVLDDIDSIRIPSDVSGEILHNEL